MRAAFHPDYAVELPVHHPFPMRKFPLLAEILRREGLVRDGEWIEPEEVEWDTLALAHTARYLDGLRHGTLGDAEIRRLGLPWSPALVRRSRLATRGTIEACLAALEDGLAANLGGGTHHALPDGGEGFCVINDIAVAVRWLRREGYLGRVMLCDLDVHHGNGNAVAFADDPETYTFSMHGARNFPLRKPPSDRDVPLEDGTGDDESLAILERELPAAIAAARPDLVIYLGGVDVVTGDRFGRLALTPQGLRAREEAVLETVARSGLPMAITLSGGYAVTPERTADFHAEIHRAAARRAGRIS